MNRMRPDFNQQLDLLRDQLVELGNMVDDAIQKAVHALVNRDSDEANGVIRTDKTINELRYQLEEESYRLLAMQQPVLASDLRRVVATTSLASNLERMADHAAGIAVLAKRLNSEPEFASMTDITRMADMVRAMLQKGLRAFAQSDAEIARQMVDDDRSVNQLNAQILQDLLYLMAHDPQTIRRGTYLFWVVHNLERIGDRSKNIGERIVYITTGELADFDVPRESEAELDAFDPLGNVPL